MQRILHLAIIGLLFILSSELYALPAGAGAGVRAAVSGVAAQSQYAASASAKATAAQLANAKNAKAGAAAGAKEPEKGYLEFVAGVGIAQVKTGKSLIGVFSPFENDLISQSNNDYHSTIGHIGIGYHYYLGENDRYNCKKAWFPSIEPILNLSYYDLQAKGIVYLFGIPALGTSKFNMPLRSKTLTIDILLNIFTYNYFSFFVLGGIGEAWTQVNYYDQPNATGLITRPALNLNSRSQSNAIYEWGAGLSYTFNPRLRVALEYFYTHIGDIRTSGNGTLGGFTDNAINPASFSLRSQAFMLDFYASFC